MRYPRPVALPSFVVFALFLLGALAVACAFWCFHLRLDAPAVLLLVGGLGLYGVIARGKTA